MRFKIPYHWKRKLTELRTIIRDKYRSLNLRYHFLKDDLYEFNRKAYPWLNVFSIFLSIIVFASILLPFAFPDSENVIELAEYVDSILLITFGIYYYVRAFLSGSVRGFIRSRWAEGILATLSFFIGLDLILFKGSAIVNFTEQMGMENTHYILLLSVQIYLVLIIAIKILQALPRLISQNNNPPRLVMISFLVLIFGGMLLLLLPSATVNGEGLSVINALFMSTSAVCVTGLIVVDTATQLTMFGQMVILILIQIGGIGVITFATFLAMYLSGRLGLAERNVLQEVISGEEVLTVTRTMKHIIFITLLIEGIGAAFYYLSWGSAISDPGERLWFSIFHSISAFCNAGFSVYTDSLVGYAESLPVNMITMILIVLGGLGFTTIWELMNYYTPKRRRKRLSVHTTIVLKMTWVLIVFGTLIVLFLEWDGVLADYTIGKKVLISAFQSVTSRTAGFNTINTGALSAGATMIVVALMIVGGSPSSTAGGLKTTTVYVLYKSMISNIRGRDQIEISKRRIPNSVVFKAVTGVILAFIFLLVGLIFLSIYEELTFLDLFFEQVSAFMTVGLSRGITSQLSNPGKIVIILSMFAGRVGMLTVAIAFAKKSVADNYSYPEESVMVA